MYTVTQAYAHVKGFNIQPDWGRNGIEIRPYHDLFNQLFAPTSNGPIYKVG